MQEGQDEPREEKLAFLASLLVTVTLYIAAFQYFLAEGLQLSLDILSLVLTCRAKPNPVCWLHPRSAFKGQGLPASGRVEKSELSEAELLYNSSHRSQGKIIPDLPKAGHRATS